MKKIVPKAGLAAVKKYLPVILIVIATVISIIVINQTPIHKTSVRNGSYYEKGIVTEVTGSNLITDEISGMLTGTQDIQVKITTGKFKDQIYEVKNYANYTHNVVCKEGTKLILAIDEAQNEVLLNVYTYDRTGVLTVFFVIFCGVLCIIGGKKGLKSLFALLYTFACVLFLFIPMMYKGVSPVLASILIAVLSTFVTMYLIDGWNAKTISSIAGTIICVSLAGLISSIVGGFANINGFTLDDTDALVVAARSNDIKIHGILFAGILISSLGAIMDVTMSIASSLNEVYVNSPRMNRKQLFQSGMNVGRDMMGTMSNTLILAFTGGAITSIMLFFSYEITLYEIFSMPSMVTEIIQGLSGCLAIFLAVPIVSLLSSGLLTRKHKTRH